LLVQPLEYFVVDVLDVDETLPYREIPVAAISLDLRGERFHLGQDIDVFQPEVLFAQLGGSKMMPLRITGR
jgi:hypothetical protein